MCERDEWRLPDPFLQDLIELDKEEARRIYGTSALAKKHEFPCLGVIRQTRKQTSYVMLVLGAVRNCQGVIILDGPSGSDLPNGKRGEQPTIGRVFTATSSAATRVVGNSNKNGWEIKVQNCIEMELRVTRPVENGQGLAGVTMRRLLWMLRLWQRIAQEAARNEGNLAFAALVERLAEARRAGEAVEVPDWVDGEDEEGAYRLWAGFQSLAFPNRDKDVRIRGATASRQLKRSSRPRKKRLPVGTSVPDNTRMVAYEGCVRVDPTSGHVSVLSRAAASRKLKTWVPLRVVCEKFRTELLTACMRDILDAVCNPNRLAQENEQNQR